MGNLFFDLKFALRQLRKSPGFAATAIAMLAFGIGATTAIFSIVEGVLLRPLPFPDSGRLVVLTDRRRGPILAATARRESPRPTYAPTPATRALSKTWADTPSHSMSFPASENRRR
jgi:hypothetical protein